MIYNFDEFLFQILTIDRFYHKEGKISVNARPYAALSFRERGTGVFKIGHKVLKTTPGDVLFIPCDTPYEVEYSTSESIVVNMSFCNYSEAEVIELHAKSGVAILFSRLLSEWQENHSVNRAKANVYGILEKIGEYDNEKTENSVLAECVQYIEQHLSDPELNVNRICEVGFISRSNLYRLFINRFGISPMQFVIKQRLSRALDSLTDGVRPVKEIAVECGFSDEKYFSRAFKKRYGYSPAQLRKHTMI